MPTVTCTECEDSVPDARYCTRCGASLSAAALPPESSYEDGLTERLSEWATDATHPSVTFETLRSDPKKYDRPIGGYLHPDERPVAVFDLKKLRVRGFSERSWTLSPGLMGRGHLLLSTERLLALVPSDGTAQVAALSLAEVTSVEVEPGLLGSAVAIGAADGSTYAYALRGVDGPGLEEAAELVRERSEEKHSAESEAKRFVTDIETAIAEGETAEGVLREVADLFAAHDRETRFDHAVEGADSIDDLFARLSARSPADPSSDAAERSESDPESAAGSTPVPASDASSVPSALTGSRPPRLADVQRRVTHTLRNADPGEVAKYSLAAGVGFGAYAVSAPFSTTAGLALLAAGGAATGAYASSHPNSLAARIDPVELALNARARGKQWSASAGAKREGTGAALGTLEYLAPRAVPGAYAHWVANADFDSVMEGSDAALRAADESGEWYSPRGAAALGGGAGLLYSYLDEERRDELRDLEEVLDADLYATLEDTAAEGRPPRGSVDDTDGDSSDAARPADPAVGDTGDPFDSDDS